MLNIRRQLNNLHWAINGAFLCMLGTALPILLLPIVKELAGYSEIIEEIVKAVVVFFLILPLSTYKARIALGLIFGFLFGLSEIFFYLNNIFQLGDFSVLWNRLFFVVPMHMITVLLMIFSGLVRRLFLPLGLFGAIILHILFNSLAR